MNNIKCSPQIITLNTETFDTYVTNGQFNENVNDGDIINIEGKLDGERYSITVNKPVNITSFNNDAYINLYTSISQDYNPLAYEGGMFQVVESGSNSNISNLYFENTRLFITGTSNVHIDNISVINGFAKGTGQFSIRNLSENITVMNSYFKSENSGSSNFVLAGAKNCLIENNTIEGYGSAGNLFGMTGYYTTFSGELYSNGNKVINKNITIKNNFIKANDCESDICYGLLFEGLDILVENNTIIHRQDAVTSYATYFENATFKNNYIPYGTFSPEGKGLTLINNTFNNVYSSENALIINNTFNTLYTKNNNSVENNEIHKIFVDDNNILKNNNIEIVSISGENVTFDNNTVNSLDYNYSIEIKQGININITNNNLSNNLTNGNEAVVGEATLLENNTGIRYVCITNENYLDYGTLTNAGKYTIQNLQNNDYLYIKLDSLKTLTLKQSGLSILNLYNLNQEDVPQLTAINPSGMVLNIFNCYLPYTRAMGRSQSTTNIFNSTLKDAVDNEMSFNYIGNVVNSTFIRDLTINSTFESNTTEEGYLTCENYPASIYISNFDSYDLIIDKSINITAINLTYYKVKNSDVLVEGNGTLHKQITFLPGSEGSNITEVTFNDKVYINTSNINFKNCTFNNGVIFVNSSECILEDNIITVGDDEIPVVFINSQNNSLLNNNITSTCGSTISFDSSSKDNVIQDNMLNASTKWNMDSAIGVEDNIFIDNGELYDVDLSIDVASKLYVDEEVPVSIIVTNKFDDMPVDNGYVEVYADGIPQATIDLADGKADTTVSISRVASTRIKVWYYPTEKYSTVNNAVMVNVVESTGNIVVDEIMESMVGEEITIKASLTNDEVINEDKLLFIFADKSIEADVKDSQATITTYITPEMMDNPTLRVVFDTNNTKYNIKSNTTILNITPGTTTITIDAVNSRINDVNTLTAYIKDSSNNNINHGQIIFTNDNEEILTTAAITDGIATSNYTFTSQYNGEINAIINSTYYQANTGSNTLNIRKIDTIVTILVPDTIYTGSLINVTAQVLDEDGNSIAGAPITLTIGQIPYPEMISNDNGTLTMPTMIQSDDPIKVIATYNGNDIYTSSASETLIKNRNKTTITLDEITTTVNKTTTITATVTSEDNSTINEGQVTFTLQDGTILDNVNVENSQATITYTFQEITESTITATFTKTDNYSNSTVTTTLKVEPIPPITLTIDTTTFTIGETTSITASIHEGEDLLENVNKGKVVFKVNGKTLKDSNGKVIYAKVVNGTATIENYLIPTTWNKENLTIEAVYSGSSQCEALRSTAEKITIEEETPTITCEDITATKGDTITLKATVKTTDNNISTGKVIFKINGKTVKDSNGKVIYLKVEDGQVTTNYTIPNTYKAKNYTITAVYIATGTDRLEDTKTLTITG